MRLNLIALGAALFLGSTAVSAQLDCVGFVCAEKKCTESQVQKCTQTQVMDFQYRWRDLEDALLALRDNADETLGMRERMTIQEEMRPYELD